MLNNQQQYFELLNSKYNNQHRIDDKQSDSVMIKKDQSNKGSKHGTSNKNDDKSRDRNIYSHKQLPETRDITQISYLEKRLNEQVRAREQGQAKLLQMIKYLQATKKSKIPAQFQKLSTRKFLSPNRNTLTTLENEQIMNFKAEIAVLNSQREIQEQQSSRYLNKVKQEISQIRQNFHEFEQFKKQYMQFVAEVKESKIDGEQKSQELRQAFIRDSQQVKRQLQQLRSEMDKKTNNSQLQKLKLKVIQPISFNTLQNEVQKLKQVYSQLYKFDIIFVQLEKLKEHEIVIQQLKAGYRQVQKFQAVYGEINRLKALVGEVGVIGEGLGELATRVEKIVESMHDFQASVKQMDQSLVDVMMKVQQQFNSMDKQVTVSNKGIEQIKNLVERIAPRPLTEPEQKLESLDTRMGSIQRRIDLIYKDYLGSQLRRKN